MDVTTTTLARLADKLSDEGGEIEGYIFQKKKDGIWIAMFISSDGRAGVCQVDYCPWCGKELTVIGEHNH